MIRGLWYVTLTEPNEPDASYGRRHVVPSKDTKYCFIRPACRITGEAGSRLSPAFKRCRLTRGTGRRSRLSADIGRES